MPARSPTPRSPTTRSRACSMCRPSWRTKRLPRTSRMGRSEPRALARPRPSACRRPSAMPSRMPAVYASPSCRSIRKPCCAPCAARTTGRWEINSAMTKRTISFTLNGEPVTAEIEPHHNLVEVLQGDFNLMGARESCGQGMCGCCTVLVNGTAVSGCLYLAAFIDGTQVTTVESLASGDTLSPVQEAFIEAGAFQCGYCTPGFLLMATQLLDETPDPDDDQIRHYLSGNLCRCAAYPEIINAVKIAARKRKAAA